MKDGVKFEWDKEKDLENQRKHKISFSIARRVFEDPRRLILADEKHSSEKEKRFFCVGQINRKILTVRFTYRDERIRIFGAGIWRDFKKRYIELNSLAKEKYEKK